MAIYDGFFDATLNEETGEYDRAYSAGDFTGYFANIIGTGVCVYDNPDSFLVRLEDGKAVVSPGYLFIQGYWCKNDADYTIELPGTSSYAIAAHLNLGARMIELEARDVSQAYPDSLVLAIVSPTSADDTRYNTDLCGVIEPAGELSSKVEWAINYIDNEIESKLAQVEQDINAQSLKLDAKIAEVQAVADRIAPPPVGSIKFSASQDIGDEWLRCDGSFINERDYPELVAALGKLTPSGDKFKLISDGEISPQISNGVIYAGRIWTYSYATGKLYGLDLEGNSLVKEIALTSENPYFSDFVAPTVEKPIVLSIVPHYSSENAKLFLAQIIKIGIDNNIPAEYSFADKFIIFGTEFSGEETSLSLDSPFSSIKQESFTAAGSSKQYYYYPSFSPASYIPFVYSQMEAGEEIYYCSACDRYNTYGAPYPSGAFTWKNGDTQAKLVNQSDAPNIPFLTRGKQSPFPLTIEGREKNLYDFSLSTFGLSFPSSARVFPDAGAYLWGKDVYMVFIGTGIVFSRTLEENSYGYLDTTAVLGTITQFGYLGYSQDEGTLYLLGQDTTNSVKMAKIVLNTLYDYANDGAWLPMIASDGIPAYIKAKEDTPTSGVDTLVVTTSYLTGVNCVIEFDGDILASGTTNYSFPDSAGTATITLRAVATLTRAAFLVVNSTTMATLPSGATAGQQADIKLDISKYIESGLTLQAY